MKITKDEVAYVAHLARLDFTDEEHEKFTSQLNDILMYMDILNKVDTAGLMPMSHAIALTNAFRDDVEMESLPVEVSLANAPDDNGTSFKVPKIIE